MVRVLIVDDDDAIRDSLRLLLEDAGYAVSEADGGERALAILQSNPEPLVVLLDYLMPHMTGGELLQRVAAEALDTRHAFAFILATPSRVDTDAATHRYVEEHAVPVVAKPFDIDVLLEVVHACAARLAASANGAAALSGRVPFDATQRT